MIQRKSLISKQKNINTGYMDPCVNNAADAWSRAQITIKESVFVVN